MAWADRYKEEQILVQQEDNHNKFWAAYWDSDANVVHIRWGRIGTKGQSQRKPVSGQFEASRLIDNKVYEKQRKGYQKVEHAKFEELMATAAIVGSANKCDDMQWMEIISTDPIQVKSIQESRLYDPDCEPGLSITLETRKAYDGQNRFRLLFTNSGVYALRHRPPCYGDYETVAPGSQLHKLIQKVEEALGRGNQ